MKSPADLTPADPDARIFTVMAAQPWTLTKHHYGELAIWSRQQKRWLYAADYAAEWRSRYRARVVMGDPETAAAVTRYERQHGL